MKYNHIQSIKEVVRHLAFVSGFGDFLDRRRTRQGLNVEHLSKRTVADRFRTIYQLGVWRISEGQRSLSGAGSELAATESVVLELPKALKTLDCRVLLDVGCGDWNWFRSIRLDCKYIGIDIVPEVIRANSAIERQGVTFLVGDAISEPLPKCDVVLCREMLFHLSFGDAFAVLGNIKKSAKHIIATTDRVWFNSDIRSGDFRVINLCAAPFGLPEPRLSICDDHIFPGRRLGIWPTSEIPSYE